MQRTSKFRVFAALGSLVSGLALSLATVPAASASGPTEPIAIGGATGSTITGVNINGDYTTEATVYPGATVNMGATLTLGEGATYSWYTVGYGWEGASSASGCSDYASYGWPPVTTTFTLTAPNAEGTYNVTANLGPDYCPWSPTGGVVIAEITVAVTYDTVCSAVEAYSSNPYVTSGLCEKLYNAQAAQNSGDLKAKANILSAFVKQVKAQTGKALTSTEAANLIGFVAQL